MCGTDGPRFWLWKGIHRVNLLLCQVIFGHRCGYCNITRCLWICCFPYMFIMEVDYWLLISSVLQKAAYVLIPHCSPYSLHWHGALVVHICVSLCRYDSYGRLTNVTYPTGQVSSYRTDTDSSVRIQTEGSNKEDITVTTNLSASGTFYTLMQGECLLLLLVSGTYDRYNVRRLCSQKKWNWNWKAKYSKRKLHSFKWPCVERSMFYVVFVRFWCCFQAHSAFWYTRWTHILIF